MRNESVKIYNHVLYQISKYMNLKVSLSFYHSQRLLRIAVILLTLITREFLKRLCCRTEPPALC